MHLSIQFLKSFFQSLRVLWPVFLGIALLIVLCGFVIELTEKWSAEDGIYYAFITMLTIGYGDFTPHHHLTRLVAVLLGILGCIFTGILAAAAMRALDMTFHPSRYKSEISEKK